ncbi:membrane protein implicated in regulation of membrane protease activity [Pseudoduganella flava]|uniref:Membrane protein implicated in regulation of membrane protease activity n=1 Tax=Pseudoduganella flava TaxID=871742 RepID=A0A562Q0E3_9BURK|nr:NfeD family protein [Pseudoduganella flava]QGZ38314.1 NfeD family protein [Pseudoduganella flava]TWI50149.1 membrane protein implicated in regulation of membrane protease activity [Pseudoduganella flava]
MADWIMWLIAAGLLVALELFSGTFYLLMVALGALAGALVAFLRIDLPGQMLAASVVAIVATVLMRRSRAGKPAKSDAARDPNVNLDIGQSVHVPRWEGHQDGHTARVMYRGALWDVELLHGTPAEPGTFHIREVRGSRLIVGR